MVVLLVLAAVWVLALVPPWLGHRRQLRYDPVADFARFRGRASSPVRPRRPAVDRARRRGQVFGLLLTLDAGAGTLALLMPARWSVAVTAALVHVTVAWYAGVVRLRLRGRTRRVAPAAPPVHATPSVVVLPALRAA